MKAILYARVSTQEQADSGLGMEAQFTQMKKLCELRGFEIVNECLDDGVSGTIRDRVGLRCALEEVERIGGVLVVYSLSRLARSTRHLLDIADRLQDAGCNLVSVTESIDTTSPTGKFTFTVLAAVAQLERDLTSERTKAALAEAKAKGIVPGPKVEDDPEVVKIVMRRAGTWSQIAEDLNDLGYTTARGASFTHVQVKRVFERGLRAEKRAS